MLQRFGVRLSLATLVAVTSGAPLLAQEEHVTDPERSARHERADVPYDDPPHAIEFTLGGDGLWFAYRTGLHRGKGYAALGLFAGVEDDFVLHGQLMRFGEPRADVPFGVGVGLGLFGATVDETDDELFAITLTGAADYALDRLFGLTYPTRVGVEVSYAPDIATFADGERVLDVLARVEVDLSTWATAFAGYRQLEVDLADEDDAELDSSLQAGVRLGF